MFVFDPLIQRVNQGLDKLSELLKVAYGEVTEIGFILRLSEQLFSSYFHSDPSVQLSRHLLNSNYVPRVITSYVPNEGTNLKDE